jgi:hypothetical protein
LSRSCGELAARLLLLSFALPESNVLDVSDVGICACDRASSQITLPRRRNALCSCEHADVESVFFVMIALAIVLGAGHA